jgi:hypothetical protein
MGLEPSDFRKLQIEFPDAEDNAEVQDSSREGEDNNEQWLSAENTLLVELKLSKSD